MDFQRLVAGEDVIDPTKMGGHQSIILSIPIR